MGMFKDCGCGCKGKNQQKKFITSAVAGLLFFILANPETFMIVRKFLGNWVANQYGTPTMYGLLFHAFVFMMITWAMMNIGRGRENAMGTEEPPPPPVPETAAAKPTTLPDDTKISQPVADLEPAIPTSPAPSSTVTDGTMSHVSNMLGGYDISTASGAAPAAPLTGTNWRQCSCGDGTQIMILK